MKKLTRGQLEAVVDALDRLPHPPVLQRAVEKLRHARDVNRERTRDDHRATKAASRGDAGKGAA